MHEPIENLNYIIDVDQVSEEAILKASIVFSDPIICRQLMDAAFNLDDLPMMSEQDLDHIERLQLFFMRGPLNMLQKKDQETISFLVESQLLTPLLKQMQGVRGDPKDRSSERTRSLEIQLDDMRNAALNKGRGTHYARSGMFGDDSYMFVTSKDKRQFFLAQHGNQKKVYSHFRVLREMRLQRDYELDFTPMRTLIIESQRLLNPDMSLMMKLCDSEFKVETVITDDQADFDLIFRRLRSELSKEKPIVNGPLRNIAFKLPRRFITVNNFNSLHAMTQQGQTVKYRDRLDRGYIYAKFIDLMDPQMWNKIPEAFFLGKFIELDPSLSNTRLLEQALPNLITQLLVAHFDMNAKLLEHLKQKAAWTFAEIQKGLQGKATTSSFNASHATRQYSVLNQRPAEVFIPPRQLELPKFENLYQQVINEYFSKAKDLFRERVDNKVNKEDSKIKRFDGLRVNTKMLKEQQKIIKQLVQAYLHESLLRILACSPKDFAESVMVTEEDLYKSYKMMHQELDIGAQIKLTTGEKDYFEQVKAQIMSYIIHVKQQNPDRVNHFIADFMDDLQDSTKNRLGLRNIIGGRGSEPRKLYQDVIIFFKELVFDHDFVGDMKEEISIQLFNLMIVQAFTITQKDEAHL